MTQVTLRVAIANRKLVQLFYSFGSRIVEPYAFGMSPDGRELLRGYELSGARGWKLFDVDAVSAITLLDESFVPRPDYEPNDRKLARVFAQI